MSSALAAALGVYAFTSDGWDEKSVGCLVAALAFAAWFVAVFVAFWRSSRRLDQAKDSAPAELYIELERLRADVTSLREDLRSEKQLSVQIGDAVAGWFNVLDLACDRMRGVLERVNSEILPAVLGSTGAADLIGKADAIFREEADEILASLERDRRNLLNYPSNDVVYFMEIFRYQEARLRSFCGRSSPGVTHHGRSWAIGEGHIGHAAQTRTAYVVDDLNEHAELHQQRYATDARYFRSTIAAPILAADGRKGGLHGALCVTSDQPNQFLVLPHGRFIKVVAHILAGFFYAHELVIRRINDRAKGSQAA